MTESSLKHIKVIEVGGFIVGPYCTRLLADLGAQVIKIEPLTGDPLRSVLGSFQNWNRGKRGMSIDLSKDEMEDIINKEFSDE